MTGKAVSVVESGEWQLHEAKARFSELFALARTVGPQRVTRRGRDAVMIVSAEDYDQLTNRRPPGTLYDLIASSPMKGADLDLDRSADLGQSSNR